MKRELDPFESKLKEKLQGKAAFPEDILWKRLNDELIRSDRQAISKKRYWIFGSAFLVLLSLGTGYLIGSQQSQSKELAANVLNDKEDKTSIDQQPFKQASVYATKKESKSAQNAAASTLPRNSMHLDREKSFISENRSNLYHFDQSIFELKSKGAQTIETISEMLSASNGVSPNLAEPTKTKSSNESVVFIPESSESASNAILLDKLAIRPLSKLTTKNTNLASGSSYHKHFPVMLSASVGFEPTAFNRVQSERVYGAGSTYSSTEKGLISNNYKIGFQANLGRHLELGTGCASLQYVTNQSAQNQLVKIDQVQHHILFESSTSEFNIHEDYLEDDPDDPQEQQVNFQDSTELHLNYQLTQTIQSVQIPMTAAYIFQWNNWKFSLKSGMIYNHMTQANQVINISGFNPIRNDIQSQLNTNSYYHLIQFGAELPVGNHISIMLAPKYTYALKSISKSSMLRPNTLGLECSLKYYF